MIKDLEMKKKFIDGLEFYLYTVNDGDHMAIRDFVDKVWDNRALLRAYLNRKEWLNAGYHPYEDTDPSTEPISYVDKQRMEVDLKNMFICEIKKYMRKTTKISEESMYAFANRFFEYRKLLADFMFVKHDGTTFSTNDVKEYLYERTDMNFEETVDFVRILFEHNKFLFPVIENVNKIESPKEESCVCSNNGDCEKCAGANNPYKDMTLQEAIAYCDGESNECSDSGKGYRQLAKWLRKLEKYEKESDELKGIYIVLKEDPMFVDDIMCLLKSRTNIAASVAKHLINCIYIERIAIRDFLNNTVPIDLTENGTPKHLFILEMGKIISANRPSMGKDKAEWCANHIYTIRRALKRYLNNYANMINKEDS